MPEEAKVGIGVVLINVGSPDEAATGPVRRYLREFLGDPRVLDLPAMSKWLLLNGAILPFRPARSAHAYRKIWTREGSPLVSHSYRFATALQAELGEGYRVLPAMRYQRPSLNEAFGILKKENCRHILLFPMFPHYASSSWGTAIEEAQALLNKQWNVPLVTTVEPFFSHEGFVEAFCERIVEFLGNGGPEWDHVLFSYHGLPERHIRKSEMIPGHCLSRADSCCASMGNHNAFCYRAQCFATSRALASRLELAEGSWSTSFQSRLGKDPWIGPFTDYRLRELANGGTKRLLVVCPSFVADCLETLEEIGIRAKEDFLAAGGDTLELVMSLNDSEAWVKAAVDLVHRSVPPAWSASRLP